MKAYWKKAATVLLAAVLLFAAAACGDPDKGKGGVIKYAEKFPDDFNEEFLIKNTADFNYGERDGGKRALYLVERLKKVYYRDYADFPWRLSYYRESGRNSYLWDFGALHSMANAVYKANRGSEDARKLVEDLCGDVEAYKSGANSRIVDEVLWKEDVPGNMLPNDFVRLAKKIMKIKEETYDDGQGGSYTVGRMPVRIYNSSVGSGDPYYDDNVWIVMSLLESGLMLGDAGWIGNAEAALMYVLSGWTGGAGGGLLWKESYNTKNTCSNGPSAMACVMFHNYYKDLASKADGEERLEYEEKSGFYLGFAEYIYAWTKEILCDPIDGVYDDHIILDDNGSSFRISRGKLTYNAGTMLSAAVRLFEATGKTAYKEDALKTVKGSYQYFVTRDRLFVPGLDIYPTSDGWFHVYLVQGYLDVARVLGEDGYLEKMRDTMDYAYKNARNYYGLIKNDWSGRDISPDAQYAYAELRNAAAPIEVIALIAAYYKDKAV